MIQAYDCGNGLGVIVWACFWGDGRTMAYLIDGDFESKKHRFSANNYLEVLEAEIEPNYPGNKYIFMQDNTSIYKTKVMQWFKERGIETFD
jgi:hypothetical protein